MLYIAVGHLVAAGDVIRWPPAGLEAVIANHAILGSSLQVLMAKILDFCKRGRSDEPSGRTYEEILPVVQQDWISALMLRKSNSSSKSYLGGDPYLPPEVETLPDWQR